MNKKLRYLFLSIAGVLILASPSCEGEMSTEGGREEKQEALQLAREDMVTSSLTQMNLEAFEYRAEEKLRDYVDYLGMVSDSGLDSSFREQARENLIRLFLEGTVPEFRNPPDIPGDGFAKLTFMLDSVMVLDPLEKEKGQKYQGRLLYRIHTLGIQATDTILLQSSIEEMGVVLQKRSKEFGENSLYVWEVQLAI